MMKPGEEFTPRLRAKVKMAIGKALGPRYIPAFIFETPEIPVSHHLYEPSIKY